MKLAGGSVGHYEGKSILRFPRNGQPNRHLACKCGNTEHFSLNVGPVERKRHIRSGHRFRLQAVCNLCGRRHTLRYGAVRLTAEN